MEGEQFSLCWNNFHTNLSSGFHSLLKDEDLVDVTLAAEGKFLKAHKTVLSVCSPFFKDLFRVNPCKHPIVILPEVNYEALRSLLHFMYQGEVSVSQEEIPTFMRVAEMLKVKGLTDNSTSDATNGLTTSNRTPNFPYQDQRNVMKRPRPVKKLIRPMQPLRPLESPKLEKSPPLQTPPVKRPHTDSETTPSTSPVGPVQKEFQEPLLRPKEEPVDHEDDRTSEGMGLDIANMLDTTLSEPGPGQTFHGWPSAAAANDSTQPGAVRSEAGGPVTLLKSGRGQYVLIHDGHIYTAAAGRDDGRQLWVCVKKKTLACDGRATTAATAGGAPVLVAATGHCHPKMHDVIKRLQVPSCSISPELRLQ